MDNNELTKNQAEELINEFPALARAVQFLHDNAPGGFIGITRYTAHSKRLVPETSDVQLNGHVNYGNVLRRSVAMVEDGTITVAEVARKACVDADTAREAIAEQVTSWRKSLDRFDDPTQGPDETHYEHLGAGAKRHRETGILHISGLLVRKIIRVPGQYKPVKSKPKTLAKQALVRMTPMGKWRQYRLSEERFERVAVAGSVITGTAA